MTCKVPDHNWQLGIEEGSTTISAESCGKECYFLFGEQHPSTITLGDEREWLYMEPIPVNVQMATECPAYPVDDWQVPTGPPTPMPGYEAGSHWIAHGRHCDCNWWPVVTLKEANA